MKHKNVGDNKVLGPQGHVETSDANPKPGEGAPKDAVAAEAPRQTWWGWATGGTVETTETAADPGDDFEMVEDTNAPKLGAEKANKEEKAAVEAEEAEKEEAEAFARAAEWADGLDGREVGGNGDGVEVTEGTDEEGKVIAPEIADIHADANDGVEETAAEDSLAYFNGAGGEYGAGEELVKIRSGGVDYYLDEDADGNNVYIDHDGNVYNFNGVEEAEEEVHTEAGIRAAVNDEEAAQAGGERNEQWGESVNNTSWNEEDDDGINSDAETVIELEVPSPPQPQQAAEEGEAPRQGWFAGWWGTGEEASVTTEIAADPGDDFEVVQNPNATVETAAVDAEQARESYAAVVGGPQYPNVVTNQPEGIADGNEEYTEPLLTPTRGTVPYTRHWDDEDALVEDRHTAAAHRADKRVKKNKKPEPTSEKSAEEESIELGKKLVSKQNILENLKKELKEAKEKQQELEGRVIDPEIKAWYDAVNEEESDKEKQQGGFISWLWGANSGAADEDRNSGTYTGSMIEEEDSLRYDIETAERNVRGLELTVKQIQEQIRAIKEDLEGAEAAASAIEEEEAKMKAAAERHKNAVREERSREREEKEEEKKDRKSTAKAAAWVADLNKTSEGVEEDFEEDDSGWLDDNETYKGMVAEQDIDPEIKALYDAVNAELDDEEEDRLWEECGAIGNSMFDPLSDKKWAVGRELAAQRAGSGAPTDAEGSGEEDGLWAECEEIGNRIGDNAAARGHAGARAIAAGGYYRDTILYTPGEGHGNREDIASPPYTPEEADNGIFDPFSDADWVAQQALEAQQAYELLQTDVQDPEGDSQVADNVEGADSGWIDDDGVTNLDAQWALGAPEYNESAYTSLYVMTEGDDPSGAATGAQDSEGDRLWEESLAIGDRVALAAQQELGRIEDGFNAPLHYGFVRPPLPGEPVRVWDVQTHLLGGPFGGGGFVPDIEETNIPMGCFVGFDSVDGGSGLF